MALAQLQPAITYTFYIMYCIFLWLIKIVVVVNISKRKTGARLLKVNIDDCTAT